MKINNEKFIRIAENVQDVIENRIKDIPWEKGIEFVKNIKPSTWVKIGGGISVGLAGGVLLCQPEINRLSEQVQKGQSEIERLQYTIRGYHEKFVALKANIDALRAKEFAEQAKRENEEARSVVMYQYAAKEYIEISLKPRGDNGVLVLSEKEYEYYQIFKKVLNGEKLEQDDAKTLQNYIYPKYKKEIKGLVEYDFEELLKRMP